MECRFELCRDKNRITYERGCEYRYALAGYRTDRDQALSFVIHLHSMLHPTQSHLNTIDSVIGGRSADYSNINFAIKHMAIKMCALLCTLHSTQFFFTDTVCTNKLLQIVNDRTCLCSESECKCVK